MLVERERERGLEHPDSDQSAFWGIELHETKAGKT
jgi:hypothetical protein